IASPHPRVHESHFVSVVVDVVDLVVVDGKRGRWRGRSDHEVSTFSTPAGHAPARNVSIAGYTTSGASIHGACAALSIESKRAFGNSNAHSRPPPYAALRSFLPCTASTGATARA